MINKIGIISNIFFVLMFMWFYITGYCSGNMCPSIYNHKKSMTLSEALCNSRKIGTIFLLITYATLFILFMVDIGFLNGKDDIKTSIVISQLFLILGLYALCVLPMGKSRQQNIIHYLITGIMIILEIYNSLMISKLYYDKLGKNSYTDALYKCSYGIIFSGFVMMLVLILKYLFKFNNIMKALLDLIVSVAELGLIIFYIILLFIFSILNKQKNT